MNRKLVNGLSDCCEQYLEEVADGVTFLICTQCKQICSRLNEEDDSIDWDEEEDNFMGDCGS
jgi:hypothetical protein